jgi:hypothetical protein
LEVDLQTEEESKWEVGIDNDIFLVVSHKEWLGAITKASEGDKEENYQYWRKKKNKW